MDYAYAEAILTRAVYDEVAEPGFRFHQCHAVQINLRLYAESAAGQLAHRTPPHVLSMKAQGTTRFMFQGVDIVFKALQQNGIFVCAPESRLRFWLGFGVRHALIRLQPLCVRHRFSKCIFVVISHGRVFRLWCAVNIEYSERDHTDQPPIALQPERADPDPIMKILVSNDDGYLATGINVLTTALEAVADIVVMAPDRNRSAASNSLTLSNPLRVSEVAPNRYKVDGTPSDCVHLALTGFLDFEPDLVVSGINHGANLGDDVIYSGTVAAAMEGRFLGLPTIAVSLVGHNLEHFQTAAAVAVELVQKIERAPLASDVVLNVNAPNISLEALKGVKATRLGFRHKSEQILKDLDPYGRPIYWVGPAGEGQDAGEGTDFFAIEQGYASVTPLKVDLTRHSAVKDLGDWLGSN